MLSYPRVLGGPQKRGQNQNWLARSCLLRNPKDCGNAMFPLHSRLSPEAGRNSHKATSTLPSGGPTSRGGILCNAYALEGPQKRDKIRTGCLNLAF